MVLSSFNSKERDSEGEGEVEVEVEGEEADSVRSKACSIVVTLAHGIMVWRPSSGISTSCGVSSHG